MNQKQNKKIPAKINSIYEEPAQLIKKTYAHIDA